MSERLNNFVCCGLSFVPRYKRTINNIFPKNPRHGLEKDYLERLRVYAIMKPDKLERSFRYMSEKIERFLRNENRPYVILGIKAMTDTMRSCSDQLNSFVDHYLRTLSILLEQGDDLELIEHVIVSFESYCQIREETANYQRNYEFFVDHFTHLCHVTNGENAEKFRLLGLRGHHALIKKTTSDEPQNPIWKYMDRIVPSIIFNVKEIHRSAEEIEPEQFSESVLADLFMRANNKWIDECVRPILTYFDDHEKWFSLEFGEKVFLIMMNSIQFYQNYSIIRLLLNHLEKIFHETEKIPICTKIVKVLQICLCFAVDHRFNGLTLFTEIQRMIYFLRKSFYTKKHSTRRDEEEFRSVLVQTIENFFEKLVDFQLNELMNLILTSFIVNQLDPIESEKNSERKNLKFQIILLEMIRNVIFKRRRKIERENISTDTTFPHRFFDPLLKGLTRPEFEIRLLTIEILRLRVDQRNLSEKFRKIRFVKDLSELDLPRETQKGHFSDLSFLKKFGDEFRRQIFKSLMKDNNNEEIIVEIFCLMSSMTIEASNDEVLVEMIYFSLELQSSLVEQKSSVLIKIFIEIFRLIGSFLSLISKFSKIVDFISHVNEVLQYRTRHYPLLVAKENFSPIDLNEEVRFSSGCLFNREKIVRALEKSNFDTRRLKIRSAERSVSNKNENIESEESELDEIENEQDEIRQKTQRKTNIQKLFETNSDEKSLKSLSIEDVRRKPLAVIESLRKKEKQDKFKKMDEFLHENPLPTGTKNKRCLIPVNPIELPSMFTC